MAKKQAAALWLVFGLMTAVPVCAQESAGAADTVSAPAGSIVINNDGEAEQLTIDDLIQVHSDNQLRWDKNYAGAKVFVTSEVTEIKTDEWLVLENTSYTPHIVLHLGNGWLVSGADSALAETLNVGDKVQFTGTITGFMKYQEGVAVIYTTSDATCVQRADEAEDHGLETMIASYIDGSNYKEAGFWLDYYKANYAGNVEAVTALQNSLDEALENCYQGTYLDKYDVMFTCTDVVPCEVENYGEGYDYYDPVHPVNANTYLQHMKNKGFRSTENKYASATVNGVTETYAALVNDDDVLVAMGQGDDYVRILVWSKEAYNDRKAASESGGSGEIVIDNQTIQKVQEALNAKGYDCGTPDGDKGPKTTSVIRQYQADNGLEATGEIDSALLASLGIS